MKKDIAVVTKSRSRFARWVAQQGNDDPEATYHCVTDVDDLNKAPDDLDDIVLTEDDLPDEATSIEIALAIFGRTAKLIAS